ncbi:MAG: PrsW family intramembrane metalloprotease [Chloroflexi bacterium]|nr:PrsW family intramembrane metalloprotease [Chloroflexota bacterium]
MRGIKAGVAITGLILTLTALLGLVVCLVVPLWGGRSANEALRLNTILGVLVFVSGMVGLLLFFQGLNSLRGQPSKVFQLPPTWLLALLFATILIIGETMRRIGLASAYLFPPFHIFAVSIPALAILSVAARRWPGADWRTEVLQLAYGTILAPALSAIAEFIGIFLVSTMTVSLTMVLPGGQARIQELMDLLSNPAILEQPSAWVYLLSSPPMLIIVAALVLFLGPLFEEAIKGLGVAFLSYRRPSRNEAILWGLTCGLGFATVETAINVAILLDDWPVLIGLRLVTMAVHGVAGALMGLGWYHALVERRVPLLLAMYLLSVALHGIWNGAVAFLGFASLAF